MAAPEVGFVVEVFPAIIAPQKAAVASAGRGWPHSWPARLPCAEPRRDVSLGMPAEPEPQYPANLRPLDPLLIVAGFKRLDHMVA